MFRKICSFLSTIILVVLIVLAGLLFVPYIAGCSELAVLTGSMEPTIPVGSLIYIKEVQPENLQPGDVITYHLTDDTLVTHRVVEVNTQEQYVITQGDANSEPDGQIQFEQIKGKMLFHLPYLGYISLNIRTKVGIYAICGILVAIILLTFLPEIFTPEEEGAHASKKKFHKSIEQQSTGSEELPGK